MHALILNGSHTDSDPVNAAGDCLSAELKQAGWTVETFVLRDTEIAACVGCFGCWNRWPGKCGIDDDGRNVVRELVKSDLLVFLTPITFGGYSSQLKKALDRIISFVAPFFTKVQGETHHKKRYDKSPHMLAIGTLPQHDRQSETTFAKLVGRNALNFHAPAHVAGVLLENQPPETVHDRITTLLTDIGALP